MILLDFSKAFDKVPHNHLLLQLNHYGIQGQTFQSFPVGTHSICGSWRCKVWGCPSDIWCPSRNSPRTYPIPSIHQWPPPASLDRHRLQDYLQTTAFYIVKLIVLQMQNYFSMTWMPSKTGKEPGWCHSIQRSVPLWVSALVGPHITYRIHHPWNCPYAIQNLQISRTSSLWWLQMVNPHLPYHKEGVTAAVLCPQKHQKSDKIIQRNSL